MPNFNANALLSNPWLPMGAAMLDPRGTYGSFGASLNKGLLAGAQSQAANQQMQFMKMQMDAYEKQKDREAKRQEAIDKFKPQLQGLLGSQGGRELSGPTMGGGMLQSQPSGMYAQNPQMAGMLSGMADIAPVETTQMLLKQAIEGQDPTSNMQNYQYLRSIGMPEQVAMDRAFSGGVNVNVGGSEGPDLGDLTGWTKMTESALKPYDEAALAFGQLNNALRLEDNPFSSIASITKFAKALDPESVVRGSETETVRAANGLFSQLQGLMNQAQNRGSLTSEQRMQMAKVAAELQQVYIDDSNRKVERYRRLGQQQGVGPDWTPNSPVFPEFNLDSGYVVRR